MYMNRQKDKRCDISDTNLGFSTHKSKNYIMCQVYSIPQLLLELMYK